MLINSLIKSCARHEQGYKSMKSRLLLIAISFFVLLNPIQAESIISSLDGDVTNIGKSTNNDKYWYGRCVQGKRDANGAPIQDSFKYLYPENGCAYEICFSYSDDSNSSIAVYIYLNEIKDNKVFKSELLGTVIRGVDLGVKFNSDEIDIYDIGKTYMHIKVRSDGVIALDEVKNGSIANGYFRIFQPSESATVVYNIRYGVLVDKLKQIVNQSK